MQDDVTLIKLILEGDQDSYVQLINKHKQRLYAFIYRMMGQTQDAQDMTQEVFIKAYLNLHRYTHQGSFWTWLSRIAYHHCIDEIRKRKRIQHIPLLDIEIPEQVTPEDILLEKEQTDTLWQLVIQLPPDYRDVILLRHVQQLSYNEISDVIGLPVSTVQIRLHRARKKLREMIVQQSTQGGKFYELLEV
ncbi:RNA polymerase sigma factor [Paenibacillus sp. 481]|uniref:RNA polymerase sigma factor n=1 Tax=Paenibacillus sp. 481 TaxID=2835869 RepID=UPI001E6388C4|nr:sigma-70 family RNA polymerase sigma factor [Paenibacillus sp. 481]UHA74822.1 sigma-70 family RNA polymerase sigma factor [Paenibacillus sp. 481]